MKGILVYAEKWSNSSDSRLTCVGFSRAGSLVAYGSVDGLTIASVDNGQIQAMVKNPHSPVVALEWLQGDVIACAFSNGAIARVTLSLVRELLFLKSRFALTLT